MVFNDEAHHIHEVKKEGETTEVEWQKSLMRIAETKQHRFVQVDFSATPYNDVGSGKHKKKVYFPHIIVDFDLKTAMKMGLVKSLVLDKRKEIGALPLEFRAERDEQGNPILSEGQIIMLRAGLQKLNKLAVAFATIDPKRYPKMLVVCEDTTVSPLVAKFMQDEGLSKDEVMTIDSSKKGELKGDWASYKELLFDVDRHKQPKVIVSVLMLREGFDVNNICVIVPLRSSQAQILLEQTIGRGLRLMWRDPEYTDSKRENRALIGQGKEPSSMIDVLSIVEHPAFNQFYAELIAEGLAGEDTGENTGGSAGDLIKVELVEDYSQYDFAVPFIVQEAEETIAHNPINVNTLIPFTSMDKTALKAMLGKGDVFVSQDLQAGTLFGDYRVQGAVMQVSGYNEYLSRITRRIGQALSTPLKGGNKIATHQAMPYLQVAQPVLSEWIDDYIHERLFNESFEPMEDENWRLLMLKPVIDHIKRIFSVVLIAAENRPLLGKTEVSWRHLSEVNNLVMRESNALDVTKCIYPKLSYSNKSGGLEKSFIQWAQRDASVDAFCKISETKHTFVQLRYLKVDSIPGFYSPDFFVRCGKTIYLVETKGQQQTIHPNVQRKLKSAVHWCERINQLPEDDRNGFTWRYVLLGQKIYEDWQQKGARLGELLEFSRVRDQAIVSEAQIKLL
jgi:type III restriction enzyme